MQGPLLKELRVEITTRCRLRCRYCYSRHLSPPRPVDLDRRIFAVRLEEAAQLGLRTVSFTGGEPLVVLDRMLDFIRMAMGLNLETGLLTSGFGIENRLVDKLADAGLTWVRISVDADPADNYAQTLLGRTFRHTAEAIAAFQKRRIPVVLRPTATRHMIGRMHALARFAAECKVQRVEVQPYMPCGVPEIDHDYWMSPETHFLCLRELLEVKDVWSQYVDFVIYPGWFAFLLEEGRREPVLPSKCGRSFLFIDVIGSVKTCAMSQYRLDTTLSHEVSLREIWYNHPYLRELRQMGSRELCADCEWFAICRTTWCPAVNSIFGLAVNDPTPVCPKVMLRSERERDAGPNQSIYQHEQQKLRNVAAV